MTKHIIYTDAKEASPGRFLIGFSTIDGNHRAAKYIEAKDNNVAELEALKYALACSKSILYFAEFRTDSEYAIREINKNKANQIRELCKLACLPTSDYGKVVIQHVHRRSNIANLFLRGFESKPRIDRAAIA